MSTPILLCHLRLDEPVADVSPSDAVGNLGDLHVDTGIALPPVVDAFTGRGRAFSSGFALDASDAVTGATLATRDVTVQAILAWDIAGQNALASPGVIVARGKGNAAAEYVSYALELRVVSAALGIGEVRFWWQDTAGNVKTQVGAHFYAPASTAFLLVTAVRRWISSTEVELRYYLGDQLIGEFISIDGDIGGGTTGTFCLGTRYNAGVAGKFLVGTIDELRVFKGELCAEEIAATWDRLSRLQPRGYRAIRDLFQPDAPVANEPTSRIQKLFRIMGHAIGFAAAQVENMRLNFLPDRAYGVMQERWERVTREAARAADSILQRRRRVLAHLRQRLGTSIPGVNSAIAELLGLASSQIEYIAFDNTQRDDWSAGLRTERWRADPSAQWTIASGALRVQAAGAANVLFNGASQNWYTCLLSVDGSPRYLGGAPSCDAFLKVSPTTLPDGGEVGVVFWDWARRNAFLLGVRKSGANVQVVSERFLHDVSQGVTVHATTALTPHWLQLRQDTSALIPDAGDESLVDHTVLWSTTGPSSGFASAAGIQFCYCVNWIGMYARANVAALPGALDASFDDVAIRSRRGTRPFRWYVFRDPALPGTADLISSRRAVARIKHAHTEASVITTKSVLAGNPNSPAGTGPAGGF